MIPRGRRKTDHFFGLRSARSALVSGCLVAAGGVVDLHVRLQVVAVHVEAEGLAVVLDRLCFQTNATTDEFLFVVHGRDAVEHVVARIANIVENLLFKR